MIDYWFFEKIASEHNKTEIKKYLKRLMRRVIGVEERVVDYLGTFEGASYNNAIFLVLCGRSTKPTDEHPIEPITRFHFHTNNTCKRMLVEVKQLLSVRYPGLYRRFMMERNAADRRKLGLLMEKTYAPKKKRKRANKRKVTPVSDTGNDAS